MSEPTPVNVPLILARMDALVDRQADLTRRLDDLAQNLAASYVPKSTYDAHREADARRFAELEKDNDARGAFNRQILAGLLIAFVIQIVLAIGVINNARGG